MQLQEYSITFAFKDDTYREQIGTIPKTTATPADLSSCPQTTKNNSLLCDTVQEDQGPPLLLCSPCSARWRQNTKRARQNILFLISAAHYSIITVCALSSPEKMTPAEGATWRMSERSRLQNVKLCLTKLLISCCLLHLEISCKKANKEKTEGVQKEEEGRNIKC